MRSGAGGGEKVGAGETSGKASTRVTDAKEGTSKESNDSSAADGANLVNEDDSKNDPLSEAPLSPSQTSFQEQEHTTAFQHFVHPQQTMGYCHYQQGTPPPPSPVAAPGASGYDIHAVLLQQQAIMAGNPFASQQYSPGIPPPPPLSPSQSSANNNGAGTNAPNAGHLASPLMSPVIYPGNPFDQLDSSAIPRMGNAPIGAPLSPGLSYLPPQAVPNSPIAAFTGVYQGGQVSPDSSSKWPDRSQQDQAGASPHLHPQGFPVQYQTQISLPRSESNQSSHSFDELLPPSALGRPDQTQVAYSQYAARGGTLFAHQHSWGYNAGRDTYGSPHSGPQQHYSPGQHRPGGYQGRHGGPHMGHHAGPPYYATTTPGPPIQTTASNKGPDGANLFIFHIPNHFTNLDMYNLFFPYGNLLSVRIMVEKDTGRSRGFGFVSYDTSDSAAMAIKDLNGFVIGNKRLKVQHKQIRASEHGGPGGPQLHESYNESSPYDLPLADGRDTSHGGLRDGSGPLPNWYGGPQAAGLESDDSPPPGSGALTQEDQSATDGGANNEKVSDGEVPVSSEKVSRPVLPPPPFSQESASPSINVTGGNPQIRSAPRSASPLEHFESIRSALPDVAKETF